jgi:DNA-binding CsgD family transcriptional regulator
MPMPPGSWNIEDSEPLRPIKAVPRGPPVRRRIISNEETENDPEKLRRILKERIKELNGLYALTQIAEAKIDSIEEVLKAVIEIISPSWQYPEITCSKITFKDYVVQSHRFRLTRWRQSAPINLHGKPVGEVIVCYLEERPLAIEGPFLSEERVLLDAIAERISCMTLRIITESELRETNHQLLVERYALSETNAALKVLMARIAEEKREIQHDVRDRIDKVLKPIIQEFSLIVPRSQRKFIDLLNDNLEELPLPFACRRSNKFDSFTPTETQICTMIKSGLRTKDIAEMRGVSPATICRHRDRIRHKLGLANTNVNLATYLKKEM